MRLWMKNQLLGKAVLGNDWIREIQLQQEKALEVSRKMMASQKERIMDMHFSRESQLIEVEKGYGCAPPLSVSFGGLISHTSFAPSCLYPLPPPSLYHISFLPWSLSPSPFPSPSSLHLHSISIPPPPVSTDNCPGFRSFPPAVCSHPKIR